MAAEGATQSAQADSSASTGWLSWHAAGFGSLGVAVGLFSGLSASPIVSTLLPLLFGLIGGAGGVYLAREDLGTASGRRRLREVGRALTVFSSTVALAALYGILVRTGAPVASLLPAWTAPAERSDALVPLRSAESRLAFASVEARLRALSLPRDRRESILAALASELVSAEASQPSAERLGELADAARDLATLIDTALPDDTDAISEDMQIFARRLRAIAHSLAALKADAAGSPEFVSGLLDELNGPDLGDSWIVESGERRRAADALTLAMAGLAQSDRPDVVSLLDRIAPVPAQRASPIEILTPTLAERERPDLWESLQQRSDS